MLWLPCALTCGTQCSGQARGLEISQVQPRSCPCHVEELPAMWLCPKQEAAPLLAGLMAHFVLTLVPIHALLHIS